MNFLNRCLLGLCFDRGGEVSPPTQRPISHNPHARTAPYRQRSHHEKPQPRSQYPTESQRREYGHTSPSPSRPKRPPPPPMSRTYHRHQEKNDRQPTARRETRWPGLNFDQQPDKISESLSSTSDDAIPQDYCPDEKPDNFHRLSSPWDGALSQDGYDELPEYYPYPTKEEEQHTFQQPTTTSTKATGRRNVPTYYFINSANVFTPSRSATPLPKPDPHYEDSRAIEDWISAVEEETEGQGTGHQESRIVSAVSALSYYSEVAPPHLRPVSDVSSESSCYSKHRESRMPTTIPEVKKWGNAKYETDRRGEYNWM